MTEHTKTDGLPGMDTPALPQVLERSRPRSERMSADKIECNACPVLCQIGPGKTGACDRYANHEGTLMSTAVSPQPQPIEACAISAVLEANRWRLAPDGLGLNRAGRPERPRVLDVAC